MENRMKYLKSFAEFHSIDEPMAVEADAPTEVGANDNSNVIKVCVDKFPMLSATARMYNAVNQNKENIPANLTEEHYRLLESFIDNPQQQLSSQNAGMLTEMAILSKNKWAKGQTITISFINGTEIQKQKTIKFASIWLQYANLKFSWTDSSDSMIRIGFQLDKGSWSYIGTDCLTIPTNRPTMNFGWLYDQTPDTEWERVVVHEFGHALGCVHEQASPVASIDWNKEAVYAYYTGSPNFWTRKQVDDNVFFKYDLRVTQFTQFDSTSIMEYPIPAQFLNSGRPIGSNLHLSQTDRNFIRTTYPFPTRMRNSLIFDEHKNPLDADELITEVAAELPSTEQINDTDLQAELGKYYQQALQADLIENTLASPEETALSFLNINFSNIGKNLLEKIRKIVCSVLVPLSTEEDVIQAVIDALSVIIPGGMIVKVIVKKIVVFIIKQGIGSFCPVPGAE